MLVQVPRLRLLRLLLLQLLLCLPKLLEVLREGGRDQDDEDSFIHFRPMTYL